jgi:hypothetical protein
MRHRSTVRVALPAILLPGLALVPVSGQGGALAGTHETGPGIR